VKVMLKVPLSPYSGYGNDGIGICRALVQMGADVYVEPTTVQAPLPADVAALLTKTAVAPFDLAIIHVDPSNIEATPEVVDAAKVVVGWTMWEYSSFGNLPGRSTLRKRLKGFTAMIAYDSVSADCIREYYSGPVLTQQGGFWPEDWPEIQRDWENDNFRFCMVGVLSARKNPFLAIQAFSELREEHEDFAEKARLSLKTMAPGLHPKMEEVYPGLRIYYDIWDAKTLRNFYAAQHVLLAPSRGEGKNMPALEFQSTGGVVVATAWGGHNQWLMPGMNYAIDYALKPVKDGSSVMQAEADLADLKRTMLHLFRNRFEARRAGEIAARTIPSMCSWTSVMDRLFEKLQQVPGGERLWLLRGLLHGEVKD
jgi:glycosyltransferase involved in cell wall biosynthesis